jgi:hypothetical protein
MLNLLGVKKLKVYSSSFSLENYTTPQGTHGGTLVHISVDVPSYSLINYQNTGGTVSRVKTRPLMMKTRYTGQARTN